MKKTIAFFLLLILSFQSFATAIALIIYQDSIVIITDSRVTYDMGYKIECKIHETNGCVYSASQIPRTGQYDIFNIIYTWLNKSTLSDSLIHLLRDSVYIAITNELKTNLGLQRRMITDTVVVKGIIIGKINNTPTAYVISMIYRKNIEGRVLIYGVKKYSSGNMKDIGTIVRFGDFSYASNPYLKEKMILDPDPKFYFDQVFRQVQWETENNIHCGKPIDVAVIQADMDVARWINKEGCVYTP